MVAGRRGAAGQRTDPGRVNPCLPARNDHYVDAAARRFHVLKITTRISFLVSAGFGVWQLAGGYGVWQIGVTNVATGLVFLLIPLLRRFGELVAPLTFVAVAYASLFFITWNIGTDSGLQFYYLIPASLLVLLLGIERIALAAALAGLAAVLAIVLEILVPGDTGLQPVWTVKVGFAVSVTAACVMSFATIWYALREIGRAEAAMDVEYQRSETLLANILPTSIAARLKDPARTTSIADRYDDASILFADIAGFTEWASRTAPCDLVDFLDRFYGEFDALVDRHRLEKIKTSGDSYMVVSGVPETRPDHLQALAGLALDMVAAVARMRDPEGRPVPVRIGLAAGPVVAGVVGSRRFFYDVWGDAVNVAARMETTDQEGRIQVPHDVYGLLRDEFEFEDRGDVDVKGKGIMHTWYLTGRKEPTATTEFASGDGHQARL